MLTSGWRPELVKEVSLKLIIFFKGIIYFAVHYVGHRQGINVCLQVLYKIHIIIINITFLILKFKVINYWILREEAIAFSLVHCNSFWRTWHTEVIRCLQASKLDQLAWVRCIICLKIIPTRPHADPHNFEGEDDGEYRCGIWKLHDAWKCRLCWNVMIAIHVYLFMNRPIYTKPEIIADPLLECIILFLLTIAASSIYHHHHRYHHRGRRRRSHQRHHY